MAASNPRIKYLAPSFGIFIGLLMALMFFMPNTELADYDRLTSGDGVEARATFASMTSHRVSGRRGGSSELCSNWKYAVDGAERFHLEVFDCGYEDGDESTLGTPTTVIYDPDDLGTTFVKHDAIRDELAGQSRMFKIIGVAGAALLALSIGLIVWLRRRTRAGGPAAA